MATETVPLSGSVGFGAILVGTGDLATGTIIHTATMVAGEYDELNLTVQNIGGAEVQLTLCIPLLDPEAALTFLVPMYVPADAPPMLQDFWMTQGAVLRAVATEPNAVVIKGFVTRQSPPAASTENAIKSTPPQASFKVTNIYVDPVTGRLITEYDDTPAP